MIANAPVDTSSVTPPKSAPTMPPTPRSSPSTQEIRPPRRFAWSFPLPSSGFSRPSRPAWPPLSSLVTSTSSSCPRSNEEGPGQSTPTLPASLLVCRLVSVGLPGARLRQAPAHHVADRKEGEEHPTLGGVE